MMFFDKILKKLKNNKDEAFSDKIKGVYSKEYLSVLEKKLLSSSYTLVLVDIDNFTKINNFYGRDVGDILLSDVVKIIKTSLRDEDIIVRMGGDEFLIILKKDKEGDGFSFGVGERIVQKLELASFNIGGNKIKLTASAGIYLDPEKDPSLSQAIEKVYKALFMAKQKGKNRVEVYKNALVEKINKRLLDIKEAINENRIVCFYQPIFSIDDFKTIKYESLVRMITKERKIVAPGMFLNQIVNTPVYGELTKKIIEFNIGVIRQKNVEVSINLLPSDMIDTDFVSYLLSIDRRVREKITIEILESENIEDYNILRNNISKLREYGYKIALDDFGSGYSNLLHVVELRFDYLKIDGQIVRKVDKDPVSYSVVKAIKGFASELGIDTVAEFVSSKEIFDRVKEIGIKYGQGNYFKEAIPATLIR